MYVNRYIYSYMYIHIYVYSPFDVSSIIFFRFSSISRNLIVLGLFTYFAPSVLKSFGESWFFGLFLLFQIGLYRLIYLYDRKSAWKCIIRFDFLCFYGVKNNLKNNEINKVNRNKQKHDKDINKNKKNLTYFVFHYRGLILYMIHPFFSILISIVLGIHYSKFRKNSFLYSDMNNVTKLFQGESYLDKNLYVHMIDLFGQFILCFQQFLYRK
jgi:hypothetical protein